MRFRIEGLTQKDNKVNLIVFYLCTYLLFTAQMPRKIFVNI